MSETRQVQKNIVSTHIQSVSPGYGPKNLFQDVYLYQQLNIVQNCHTMQFKGKLINQTKKKDKIVNFGHSFDLFGPNLYSPKFLRGFILYQQIAIVPSYHSMQFTGELRSHSCENGEKPSFRPNFCPFGSYLSPPSFFCELYLCYQLDIPSYHSMIFK